MRTHLSLAFWLLTVLQPNAICAQHRRPDDSHFSILGVKIGQDSSDSLESKLGKITKCHTGGHVTIARFANATQELIFEFSEVGGGDVTGFYIQPSTGLSRDDCNLSPLPSSTSELITGGGIHLGMTQKEFVGIIGSPRDPSQGAKWKYLWTWTEKLTDQEREAARRSTPASMPPERADISVRIEARFKRGKLSYFHISRLETL